MLESRLRQRQEAEQLDIRNAAESLEVRLGLVEGVSAELTLCYTLVTTGSFVFSIAQLLT